MGDAETDLGTVQGGQRHAIRPFPFPLSSTGLTLAFFLGTGGYKELYIRRTGRRRFLFSRRVFFSQTCN
jgi:hypothetical protein